MRIGLFTDTYRPSINGIVYVIDITKKHLESLGHEVYIFCPGEGILPQVFREESNQHLVRFPSFKGAFYEDYHTSLFFPPAVLRKIKDLELDIIHIFTPGQIGVLGINAAHKHGTVLLAQHSTDVYEYTRHYPMVLPGLLMLIPLVPFATSFRGRDIRELAKLYIPRRGVTEWNQDIVEAMITMTYGRADTVIALSRKSKEQLEGWIDDEEASYPIELIPTGVDALPRPKKADIKVFREKYNIADSDEVILYVGRLGAEKNLDILIPALEKLLKKRPNARLLYVGDFEHRGALEEQAATSQAKERITFTGALPRNYLGTVYEASDIFVFPSLTDTQGLVLHEAAQAGLPIVLIDKKLSEVVVPGQNGLIAQNTATDIAKKVAAILEDETLKVEFAKESKHIARQYSELKQTRKLEKLYKILLKSKKVKERHIFMRRMYAKAITMRKKLTDHISTRL